jgi:diguanylate cyclase (GGDEF)-like protein/PAS domain S-box-containing protein
MDAQTRQLELAMEIARMAPWESTIVDGEMVRGTVYWSAQGSELTGLAPQALVEPFPAFLARVHPADRGVVLQAMQGGIERGDGYHLEYRVIWPDGTVRWLAARARILDQGGDLPLRTYGMVWDVTERVHYDAGVDEREQLAAITLNSIGDGVLTLAADGSITYLNPAAERLTGWSAQAALGKHFQHVLKLVDCASGEALASAAARCLELGRAVGVATRGRLATREGRLLDVEDSATPILAGTGAVVGAVTVFRDVSHERKLAEELSWQATHDPLTGLINRSQFESQVATALHSAKHEGHAHALLYMDLDRFKVVNDTCGHAAGDVLLQMLARMLHAQMRNIDVLARLGGDELGALLLHCPLDHALKIAEEIRQSIKEFRFVWDSRSFELGISVGLAEITADSKSMTDLLIAADQACYVAKEQGRNRIHVYKESDVALAMRHGDMMWLARLNDAFDHERFRLYAMPIVHLHAPWDTHQEVLVRLHNGKHKPILPGAFIPAAERYDLMTSIDRWVIRAVCRHIRKQRSEDPDLDAGMYSINLSGVSLGDPGLEGYVVEQFAEYGVTPARICFEITETAVIADLPKAQQFMHRLRKCGCRFSLDDFGSGVSSFGYLKALPVDFLKIDGIFVRDIAREPIHHAMVKAINEVGHVMGIKTVAEYVEDEATLAAIRELGLDYAQGYALGTARALQ